MLLEDGSMYSAEAHDTALLPKGAYRGEHLLRKSAGQVLPMTATIPLRHTGPLYADLSRWDEQGFIGPLAGELAIDPIHGRFMVPKSDHQFQRLSTTSTILRVDYNYGFTDDIGAGTYDRSSTFSRENKPSTKDVSKDGNFPSNLISDGTISNNNNTFTDLQGALDVQKKMTSSGSMIVAPMLESLYLDTGICLRQLLQIPLQPHLLVEHRYLLA